MKAIGSFFRWVRNIAIFAASLWLCSASGLLGELIGGTSSSFGGVPRWMQMDRLRLYAVIAVVVIVLLLVAVSVIGNRRQQQYAEEDRRSRRRQRSPNAVPPGYGQQPIIMVPPMGGYTGMYPQSQGPVDMYGRKIAKGDIRGRVAKLPSDKYVFWDGIMEEQGEKMFDV